MIGNANSLADSILSLLLNEQLCSNIVKNAKRKVKEVYNWQKIAQDTHFTYQKAICQTMAEKQAYQIKQNEAKKTKRAEKEITSLLGFKKRQAYAQNKLNFKLNIYKVKMNQYVLIHFLFYLNKYRKNVRKP